MVRLVRDTIERFQDLYGCNPSIVVTAPGRVNLIGEHTDYNGGFVLPVALDRTVIIAASARNDDTFNLHTVDLHSSVSASLDDLRYNSEKLWANYPLGVADVFQKEGHVLKGANFCIRGNIPIAAGLSSSGALEVASAIALQNLNDLSIPTLDLIRAAQKAETNFVGVQCGIMDQFISVMGRKDHALFLDCKSLAYSHVPLPEKVQLVICDTGVRREVARSAYNRREAECDDAVRQLAVLDTSITSLRDVSIGQFSAFEKHLTPLARKRSWHVVSENDRVLRSVEAMKCGDLASLGALMTESHISLRDNFEVSSKELNAFVEIAGKAPGVYGARMTGAGFGGSAICLVAEGTIDNLVERLRIDYPRQAGRSLTVYLASADDGAAIIDLHTSLTPKCIAIF